MYFIFVDAWKVVLWYLARLFDCVWVCLTYFEVYILSLDTWSMHVRYALSVVDHLLHWFGFRYCLIFLGENKVSYIFQSFWVKPLRIPQMEKCLISFWVRMMFWKLGTLAIATMKPGERSALFGTSQLDVWWRRSRGRDSTKGNLGVHDSSFSKGRWEWCLGKP